MIPLKYIIRNMRARWVTTLMTVLAIGLAVLASVLSFGMSDGLNHALRISADPLDLIVLRQGANDETSSTIDVQVARDLANLDGIAVDSAGAPLSSSEYVTILTKPRRNNGGTTNLIVRGLQPQGRELRPDFQIVEGRDVRAGVNEAITSRKMARRFENLAIGEKLAINQVGFEIVGYFEAGGSSAESEVWTDRGVLTGARRSESPISSVNIRARDEAAKAELSKRIKEDEQFKLDVVDETKYFEDQMTASIAMRFVGILIGGFLTIGAMFAAANAMYAAVASRVREIGTLRALGFARRSILFAIVLESVLLCVSGGLLGCLATLPFNGLSTGTANWATFSEITFAFRFGPNVLMRGVLMALFMGLVGGLFPAVRAIRMRLTDALRQA